MVIHNITEFKCKPVYIFNRNVSHYIIINIFFITCHRSFQKWILFLLRLCRGSLNVVHEILPLNRGGHKHRSDSSIPGFPNSYVGYLCDVPYRRSWIIFNQCLDLVISSDCEPVGTFTDYQIKFFSSEINESLTNNTLHHHKGHLPLLLFCTGFWLSWSKKHRITKMHLIYSSFTFNVKTVNIHNPQTNCIEKCVEMNPFGICLS